MNLRELLSAFAEFDPAHRARKSSRALEVFASLPSAPDEYVEVVREVYAGLTYDAWLADDQKCELVQRVEGILRELLYHDGRTLEALLWIVDWAADADDRNTGLGINPLAGLCNVLRKRPLPRVSDEQMLARADEWMKVDALSHNARQCRFYILRRRPELSRRV